MKGIFRDKSNRERESLSTGRVCQLSYAAAMQLSMKNRFGGACTVQPACQMATTIVNKKGFDGHTREQYWQEKISCLTFCKA
jgi:hypothetical protein